MRRQFGDKQGRVQTQRDAYSFTEDESKRKNEGRNLVKRAAGHGNS